MPVYKFSHNDTYSVSATYSETFDTEDAKKWRKLLKAAEASGLFENHRHKFPKQPPADPKVWFELYALITLPELNDDYLEETEERHSGYETTLTLRDANGRCLGTKSCD